MSNNPQHHSDTCTRRIKMNRFVIMTAQERMPAGCFGEYRKVAVVETDLPPGASPKMISERARGVVRIVREWRKLNVGKTEACAYARALAQAKELLAELQA